MARLAALGAHRGRLVADLPPPAPPAAVGPPPPPPAADRPPLALRRRVDETLLVGPSLTIPRLLVEQRPCPPRREIARILTQRSQGDRRPRKRRVMDVLRHGHARPRRLAIQHLQDRGIEAHLRQGRRILRRTLLRSVHPSSRNCRGIPGVATIDQDAAPTRDGVNFESSARLKAEVAPTAATASQSDPKEALRAPARCAGRATVRLRDEDWRRAVWRPPAQPAANKPAGPPCRSPATDSTVSRLAYRRDPRVLDLASR